MTEIDNTNKLGQIRATNVKAIMKEKRILRADLFRFTGVSISTIGNCFGDAMKTAPSAKTVNRILRSFQLEDGALDKADFDPATASDDPIIFEAEEKPVEEALPVIIRQTKITIQIGKTTIDTEVDEVLAARILKLVVLGEDL